jgi:hypothetical protein
MVVKTMKIQECDFCGNEMRKSPEGVKISVNKGRKDICIKCWNKIDRNNLLINKKVVEAVKKTKEPKPLEEQDGL